MPFCPAAIEVLPSFTVTLRSLDAVMVVLSVEELSAGLLSGSFACAIAVLLIVPAATGLTLSVIVADAAAVKLGIRHVTIPPERVQVPLVELAETKEAPAGMLSVTRTPVASAELLFLTWIV